MTFLEAVNKVLIRIREDEVSTVNETAYSKLIGELVNDSLKQVENAWDWSPLRSTVTVTTTPNIFNYVLTNTGKYVKILDVINDTSDFFLEYRPQSWFNNAYLNNDLVLGKPRYYTFNGVDGSGDTAIDLYPIPESQYAIRFNVIMRSPEVLSDDDDLLVPSLPVIHLAVAMATRERGENGGTSAPELFVTADRTLADAISLDAAKHPEETIFYMG